MKIGNYVKLIDLDGYREFRPSGLIKGSVGLVVGFVPDYVQVELVAGDTAWLFLPGSLEVVDSPC